MIQTHKLSKMVFASTDKLNTVCSKLTQFFEGYKMTHCIIQKDKYRHRSVKQNVYEIEIGIKERVYVISIRFVSMAKLEIFFSN